MSITPVNTVAPKVQTKTYTTKPENKTEKPKAEPKYLS